MDTLIFSPSGVNENYFDIPSADSADNANWGDVIGGKADTIDGDSLMAFIKLIKSEYITCGTSPDTAGTANTSTRIELDSSASAVDGAYDPASVYILSGTGAGQARHIFEYDGTNKYAYVNRDWKVTPDDTSVYCIVMNAGNTHVNEGVAQAGANNTITLNALASAQNNLYLGQTVFIVAGTGADQARMAVGYNGTSKILTVDANWIVNPDSTSVYAMLPYPGFVHGVAGVDSASNVLVRDAIGNKEDAGALTLDTASLVALARKGAKEAWEAEHHMHNVERWYGAGASKALKLASKTPFALAGANDDWGAWTTLLVPTDTPAIPGSTHFDLHRIEFEDVQGDASKKSSRFQIAWDTASDGQADALTNNTYTEWIDSPEKDGKANPEDVMMKRIATNTCYVWMRYWCLGEDSTGSDTKVFIGSHEYTDPDV